VAWGQLIVVLLLIPTLLGAWRAAAFHRAYPRAGERASAAAIRSAPTRAIRTRPLSSAEEQRAVVDSATAPGTRPSAAGTGTATQQRLRANSSKSVAYPRAQTSPRSAHSWQPSS
jgi:hypothetical protein